MSRNEERKRKLVQESKVAKVPTPVTSEEPEKFTFFFKADSPFSQFHPATFKAPPLFIRTEDDKRGYIFRHCEQWMMFNKAKLFNDEESAKKILATVAPPACKALGRKVKNFDEQVWKQHNESIIKEGNRLKFTQNPKLLTELMKTDGTTLVEASPHDRVYGIGLSADNPNAQHRSTWRGTNLLGKVLTEVREELKLKQQQQQQQQQQQTANSTDASENDAK